MRVFVIVLFLGTLLSACQTTPPARSEITGRGSLLNVGRREGGFGGLDIAKPLSQN
jgi:hypothetical protein